MLWDGLRFQYAQAAQPAVWDCSGALQPGERTVLLGPSGAGKTTLLRCLAGLQGFDAGRVQLGQQQLHARAQAGSEWRQQVSVIFQDHALIPHRSVLWHVCTGALGRYGRWRSCGWWRQADIDRAMHELGKLGLQDKAMEPVARLSGGQRQRVAIARAWMQDARVILADEPVASLDPASAAQVLSSIHRYLDDGHCCLVSMHQLELALDWAQRVLVLDNGRLVLDQSRADFNRDEIRSHFTGFAHPVSQNGGWP